MWKHQFPKGKRIYRNEYVCHLIRFIGIKKIKVFTILYNLVEVIKDIFEFFLLFYFTFIFLNLCKNYILFILKDTGIFIF